MEERRSEWQPVDGRLVVWLTEWRTYGILLHVGAHVSTITFTHPHTGERLVVQIENDEYRHWEETALGYDED